MAVPSIRRPSSASSGLIENADRVLGRSFRRPGDDIVLLGEGFGELGGSEYLKVVLGKVQGEPPNARPRTRACADRIADARGR